MRGGVILPFQRDRPKPLLVEEEGAALADEGRELLELGRPFDILRVVQVGSLLHHELVFLDVLYLEGVVGVGSA